MRAIRDALLAILAFAIATLWMEEHWAWSLAQVAVFGLAAWRIALWRRFSLPPAAVPLAIAACFPLLQLAAGTTVSRHATWEAGRNWWTFFLLFALSADAFAEAAPRLRFLRASVLFGAAIAVIAVAQKDSSHGLVFWIFPSGFKEAVLGPFVNRNQYAAWIELVLPVALWLAAAEARRLVLYGAASAILLASVAAGASRAGFLLVCSETVAVFALLAIRRKLPRRSLAMIWGCFLVLAVAASAVAGWREVASRLGAGISEPIRVEAVRASLTMVRDRPWLGSGLGTWPDMYPGYAGFDPGAVLNQAHNDWLQFAAEGGLPFAILFLLFAALLCQSAIPSIYGLGIAAFLLHALVDYPMQQRPGLAAWFFAMAGAAAAYRGRAERPAFHPVIAQKRPLIRTLSAVRRTEPETRNKGQFQPFPMARRRVAAKLLHKPPQDVGSRSVKANRQDLSPRTADYER